MKTSSQGRASSNTRWLLQRELRTYMMLPVWLMGLRRLWQECFSPLHDRILRLWKTNGSLFVTQYLSETCRIIVLWTNGVPYVYPEVGVRVRCTRSGLPLILPGALRQIFLLLKGEDHAYALSVIRATLSVLSAYRVIGCAPIIKLNTVTDSFSGTSATLPVWEVAQAVARLPRSLVMGEPDPIHVSESAGPNFKKSTWSSGLDALAFLRQPLVWFSWWRVAWALKAWGLIAWMLFTVVLLLPLSPLLLIGIGYPKHLGRLVTLFEARGKVRIIAITDWWTQVLLKPLHNGIFSILRKIPQDGTFNQLGPVLSLLSYVRACGVKVYSYDLSAATDRLPIQFQIQVLEALGATWATDWARLLVGRVWDLKGEPVRYAVGQPMGALSSWAMLAISHHLIVQIAASRVGFDGWFPYYAILGDDIVIADDAVAGAYQGIMHTLGVPINKSKSFEMSTGGLEFAKRWLSPWLGDLSPMSPGLIIAAIRSPTIVSTLILDSLGRGYVISTRVLSDLYRFLKIIRPPRWLDANWGPILSMICGPTVGLWESASGPLFKAVWTALFPYTVRNKITFLQDIIFKAKCDMQTPPKGTEDSTTALVKQLFDFLRSVGSFHRGLIWMALLICSPAFWVYHDLALGADERKAAWWAARYEFLTASSFIGDYPKDLLKNRSEALRNWLDSTFDPGLMEWVRARSEDAYRLNRLLVKAWAFKVEGWEGEDRVIAAATAYRRGITFEAIPRHLAVVPYNYPWWDSQKILLRRGEIPMGTYRGS